MYPVVDERLCTACGVCVRSCPALQMPPLQMPKQCYAAVLPSQEDLMRSPSGGAATALARTVIAQGGVVYGACGEDIFHVRHVRIDRPEEVERIRGSKSWSEMCERPSGGTRICDIPQFHIRHEPSSVRSTPR